MEREMSRGNFDKRKKGWFWCDNYVLDLGLSPKAIAVYMVICRRIGNAELQAEPMTHGYLCKYAGIKSRDTVKLALQELKEQELITVIERYDESRGQLAHEYVLLHREPKTVAKSVANRSLLAEWLRVPETPQENIESQYVKKWRMAEKEGKVLSSAVLSKVLEIEFKMRDEDLSQKTPPP